MNDLKLAQRTYFDLELKNGELVLVSGFKMKEQFITLLVYSTWKPLIGYGLDVRSFRGSRLDLVRPVIFDRIARSVAFINHFYPEEARLSSLKSVTVDVLDGNLKILCVFEGMKVNVEVKE